MKIISFDNQIYEINANEEDNVFKIKKLLSDQINIRDDKIGLVYKNRILYDDILIKDYEIASDEFVLLCTISNDNHKTNNSNDEIDSSVCNQIINENKQLDPFRLITIHVKSVQDNNSYLLTTKSNEIIFSALKKQFTDMRYLCFTYENIHIDTTNTFYFYNIGDGEIIYMENLLKAIARKTGLKDFIDISFVSMVKNHDSMSLYIARKTTIKDIKQQLSNQINIPEKNIILYKNEDGNDQYDSTVILNESKIIYFTLNPDFENIIKQDLIGRGTFGSVYKCIDVVSGKELALKEFHFSDEHPLEKENFYKEIAILSSLGVHPRIVKFEKHFMEETCFYILMEYVPGGSLGNHIRNHGPLSELDIIKISKEILEALQYLHYIHIVHRDVKGDNVLLDLDQHIKLCDFSVSKVLIHAATKGLLNGTAKSFVGTANWMAPEIISGKKYDRTADIWSFGATIIEMFTGKPPYSHLSHYAVIFRIGMEKKIDFQIPRDFRKEFKDFIDSCLCSNPSKRLSASVLLEHPFLNDL